MNVVLATGVGAFTVSPVTFTPINGDDPWDIEYLGGKFLIRDLEGTAKVRLELQNSGEGGDILFFPDGSFTIQNRDDANKSIKFDVDANEIRMVPALPATDDEWKWRYGNDQFGLDNVTTGKNRMFFDTGGSTIFIAPSLTFNVLNADDNNKFWRINVVTGKMEMAAAFGADKWELDYSGDELKFINQTDAKTYLTLSSSETVEFGVPLETSSQVAIQVNPFGTSTGNTGEIRFLELAANGTNYAAIKGADSQAGNVTYVWPAADGILGRALKTDGNGNLTFDNGWSSVSGIISTIGVTQVRLNPSGAPPGHHFHIRGTTDIIQFKVDGFAGQSASVVQFTSAGGNFDFDDAGDLTLSAGRAKMPEVEVTDFMVIDDTGSAPSAVVGAVVAYGLDVGGAGTVSLNIKNENGEIIKLFTSSAYSVTNDSTDRTYDANSTTIDEIADVLGTLISDLQATGLMG